MATIASSACSDRAAWADEDDLSQKSRQIYRAYVLDEQPIGTVAAQFGVSRNAVSQVKTRVERMIAGYEALLEE